jgi:hypothetical protein
MKVLVVNQVFVVHDVLAVGTIKGNQISTSSKAEEPGLTGYAL